MHFLARRSAHSYAGKRSRNASVRTRSRGRHGTLKAPLCIRARWSLLGSHIAFTTAVLADAASRDSHRRAAHGMYKIEANYFGSRATRSLGSVTVQVGVLTNCGRPNEQWKSLMLRLKEAKETVRIREIEFSRWNRATRG